jgi:adenosylhomocysteine nucleosidase
MMADRCQAGIIFAVPVESDAFERLASDRSEILTEGLAFREGSVGGRRVAWCVAGVGGPRAERAARLLVAGHRPEVLISAGFAGGLTPALPRGGLVCPAAVRGPASAEGGLRLAGSDDAGPLLVTVDRIVRTPAEKRSLAAATGAALVDMETLAVARLAEAAGLPCHGLRVISDAADDELPPDVARLVEPQSALRRAGTLLGMVGRRPRAAVDLWQLWERAVVDGKTLAGGLVDLLAELAAEA